MGLVAKRLAWQDRWKMVPGPMRDAYRIADRYQARYSAIFLRAMRGIMDDTGLKAFKEAWESSSIVDILESLPLYQPGITDDKQRVWNRFLEAMRGVYEEVAGRAIGETVDRINEDFSTDFVFVAKAQEIWNPYTQTWIENRILELVVQGITETQRAVVTDIISEAFSSGLRAEIVYQKIQANIGLTERMYRAVENRRRLHEAAELPQAEVARLVDRYRRQKLSERAQTIARTEMMAAQAQGRRAAYQAAEQTGGLPAVEREWISVMGSSRMCELCLSMDGQRAPVNGDFDTPLGPRPGPPLHPNCRCTEVLVEAED